MRKNETLKSINNSWKRPIKKKKKFKKLSEVPTLQVRWSRSKSSNHNEVSHDDYNVVEKILKGLLNRNKNNTGLYKFQNCDEIFKSKSALAALKFEQYCTFKFCYLYCK